jgi:hypothetical protein
MRYQVIVQTEIDAEPKKRADAIEEALEWANSRAMAGVKIIKQESIEEKYLGGTVRPRGFSWRIMVRAELEIEEESAWAAIESLEAWLGSGDDGSEILLLKCLDGWE